MLTVGAFLFWALSLLLLVSGLSHTPPSDPLFPPVVGLVVVWSLVGPVLLRWLFRWEGRA